MLTIAWCFMGIAILAAVLLLDDLRKEMEYNKYNNEGMVRRKGDCHGLQKTAYRSGGNVLRRCG